MKTILAIIVILSVVGFAGFNAFNEYVIVPLQAVVASLPY